MKFIIAVIQPWRLDSVKEELSTVEVFRLTVSDAAGVGQQEGHTEIYRGQRHEIDLLPKKRLEIAVNDSFVQPTIEAIKRGATGSGGSKVGDGKIFVLPLENVIRISSDEEGSTAI
ncbi:MAG: P-II family nitrogen regulator [Actinomycetia bacterium]|nr:P-II family nitrogen regulator [Actinomycetes bacterium]MCP4960074.1 P-II family nitrogen regulator [Actinomycetes bacterium]